MSCEPGLGQGHNKKRHLRAFFISSYSGGIKISLLFKIGKLENKVKFFKEYDEWPELL